MQTGTASAEIPQGYGVSSIFMGNLWIGGLAHIIHSNNFFYQNFLLKSKTAKPNYFKQSFFYFQGKYKRILE